jgi:hydrogenase expression/formation protein HypD
VKYLDEFRDAVLANRLLASLERRVSRPLRLMEFCGGHTHAILRSGLRQLLPSSVRLSSGPGCPVCVTASSDVDRAIALASQPGVILATFGDMVRVPGGNASGQANSLQEAKSLGADVRMVYSTLDALGIARVNPGLQVVFLGVGFETTAPTVAAAVLQAAAEGLTNFTVFSVHKLTPPATRAILDAGEVRLSGIIGPGHVTSIIGANAWEFLPRDYRMPCAVSGFEPLDILLAITSLVDMVTSGVPAVRNTYARSVRPEGNLIAQQWMRQVFQVVDAEWRGLGLVPASGLAMRTEYEAFDAARRFPLDLPPGREPKGCRCGDVLRGVVEPTQCPLFGRTCTPDRPVGPCMVSGEGACAAFLQYGES